MWDAACRRHLGTCSNRKGPLPYVPCNAVLVDTHRLWPLALVVAAGAAFDCFQAASAAGAADALPAALGPALLRWMGITGGLLGAVMAAMNWMVGGRVFTGE